jgi:predicted RND superfamily exporter protein
MNKTFFARYSKAILVLVAVLLPFTVWAAVLALATNKNDVKEWLPDTFQATRDYREFQKHFGDETFILASWDGCTLDDPRLAKLAALMVSPENHAQSQYFQRAVTGASVLDRLTNAPTNLSQADAVARLRGTLIGPDGKQTCVALTLSDLGRANLRQSVFALRDAAASLGISSEHLRMGGPPVDNVAIDLEGERMLLRLMALCGLVGVALAWWYLGDIRLTIMVLVGGVYSAAICLAIVWLAGGQMSSVLLTMPAVVYTAGLAAAIHLINYYRHIRLHTPLAGSTEKAVGAAWIPCTLSAGTTALGLISLYISELVPIKTFGLYTSVGVMVTVVFIFLYLPAALEAWPPKIKPGRAGEEQSLLDPKHRRRMRRLGTWVVDRPALVWVLFLALMVGCGSGLHRAKTTINLMSLFPADAPIINDYRWLEKHLGPLVPMEIVVRFDNKTNHQSTLDRMRIVQSVQQAAKEIPAVGGTMSAVTFAPDLQPHRGGGLQGMFLNEKTYQKVLDKRLATHRSDFIHEGYLAEDAPSDEEWWRVSLRVAALADIDYGAFIDDIRHQVEPVLDKQRAVGVQGLAGVTYTGMTPVVYMAERALLDGLVNSFFGAFAMIAIVMSLVLRDVRAGLLTMLPNVFPMAVVFGLMSWLGIALDIGTMMTASVAMGVCVDDTIHFANWFRRATRLGLDRRDATLMAYEHAAGAIYQSTAIVALGLLTFALSTFVPTRRFGLLMFTLLGCGLIADLTLPPVIMAGWLGKYFTRGCERGGDAAQHEEDVELLTRRDLQMK